MKQLLAELIAGIVVLGFLGCSSDVVVVPEGTPPRSSDVVHDPN